METEEQKIESLNKRYKSEKKLGLIGSEVSFKSWLNNIFKNDKVETDTNPNEPTDYSDKRMNLQIFGINAWVVAGTVIGIATAALIIRHYYKKSHKLSIA